MIHQHHRIAGAVVLALALAASIAPAASADPQPLARAEAAIAAQGRSTSAVRPNPDEQTVSRATVQSGPCSEVCSGGGYGPGVIGGSAASATPAVVRVTGPTAGFDWGDAGLGAAGMLALILVAVGGVLTVARRRSQSVTQSTRPDPQAQH